MTKPRVRVAGMNMLPFLQGGMWKGTPAESMAPANTQLSGRFGEQ